MTEDMEAMIEGEALKVPDLAKVVPLMTVGRLCLLELPELLRKKSTRTVLKTSDPPSLMQIRCPSDLLKVAAGASEPGVGVVRVGRTVDRSR